MSRETELDQQLFDKRKEVTDLADGIKRGGNPGQLVAMRASHEAMLVQEYALLQQRKRL